MLAQQWHQHKDRPEAVDHAGNRRQQFGHEGQRPTQRTGAHLGEKDGQADGQRNRHEQRQKRRHQRAVDKRQRAEMPVDRVPVHGQFGIGIFEGREEKRKAELVPRQLGTRHKLAGNQHHNAEDAERAQHHQPAEYAVGEGRVAARHQERAHRRSFMNRRPGRTFAVWRSRFRLKLSLGDTYLWRVGAHLIRLPGKCEQEVTTLLNQAHTSGKIDVSGVLGSRSRLSRNSAGVTSVGLVRPVPRNRNHSQKIAHVRAAQNQR